MLPVMQSSPTEAFYDRRLGEVDPRSTGRERRQFSGSYDDLTPEGRELGRAVDEYKLMHRRRFINYDEMLAIVRELGYARV